MAAVNLTSKVSGLCLAVLLCLPSTLTADQSAEALPDAELQNVVKIETEKQALSRDEQSEQSNEPLYAGTSMWLLLSIALIGSITVQRRASTHD